MEQDPKCPRPPDLMYRSRVFEVYESDIVFPDGRIRLFSWLTHKPVIVVVPVTREGRIVLLRQFRPAIGETLLEVPAGTMDKGEESLEECVQREMAEETGYRAERLIKTFEGYIVPGYCNEYMYFFLALGLYPSPLPKDEDEYIEIVETDFTDADAMIADGRIRDCKTALAIRLTQDLLRRDDLLRT